MSTFSVPVCCVASVENHENADRLSIVKLEGMGFTCISGKLEDGSPRYKVGDFVVYIPSAAVLPEWLLREMDFWNEETGKGMLSGSDGNRVKPLKLRGVFSEGVLYPVGKWIGEAALDPEPDGIVCLRNNPERTKDWVFVRSGDDASSFLGITKYSPPIPTAMAGEVANMFGHTVKYDFDRWEQNTELFESGEPVIATEKLHGTFVSIVYVPGLNHPEMFGSTGDILVHSKGLGSQGLAFKNNEANANNVYVCTLKALLAAGLEERFKMLASSVVVNRRVAIMGEIYGRGIQDLHYGTDKPEFRMFDLLIDDQWQPRDEVGFANEFLDIIKPVPMVYNGPFDVAELEKVRDGKTMLGGTNIREGIVIRKMHDQTHPVHGRKICKMISPDYLLRKSKDATEYN